MSQSTLKYYTKHTKHQNHRKCKFNRLIIQNSIVWVSGVGQPGILEVSGSEMHQYFAGGLWLQPLSKRKCHASGTLLHCWLCWLQLSQTCNFLQRCKRSGAKLTKIKTGLKLFWRCEVKSKWWWGSQPLLRESIAACRLQSEGIFQQSVLPDRVVLSLPRGRMRFRASTYPEDHELPLFLQFPQPGLIVDRDCKDMGPGTVFFNGLKHAKRRDAFFMNTPDDHVFSKNHIAMLLQFALANPGTAVASLGIHSHSQFRPCFDFAEWTTGCVGRINLGHTMGPINSGFIGHMVQPWFFGEVDELAPDDTWPKECHMHDDLWLSSLLARRGIRREAANLGFAWKSESFEHKQDTGCTFFAKMPGTMNVCNHALLDRFPGLWTP